MLKKSKFELLNPRGFTLIELIIVMAIIALLSSLLIVSMNIARARSRDTRRLADIESIVNAIEMYATTNDDLPTLSTWAAFTSSLDTFIKGDDFPADPKDFIYTACISGDNYLVAAALERPRTIKDDIDDADAAKYTIATDCITSNDSELTVLNCDDSTGLINGFPEAGGGTVACLGYFADQ